MNKRALLRLAAGFAALFAVWLAAKFWLKPREATRRLWPEGQTATRLRLGPAVELSLDGTAWQVVNPTAYPAEASLLQDILDRLPKARVSEFLTENPAKHPLFEVTESSGLRLSAFAGGERPALDIWVGKTGTDYDTFYFRHADASKVYEARGLPRYLLDRQPRDWFSKLVLSVESDRIQTLGVKHSSGTLKLERREKKWLLGGAPLGEEAVRKALEPMLVALVRLEADTVLPSGEAPREAFAKPSMEIELAYTDREGKPQNVRLRAGRKTERGTHLLNKEGESRVVFELSTWKLDPFRKTPKDFKTSGS